MFRFPDLTEDIRIFLSTGLVISPWLAGVDSGDRFDAELFHLIDYVAREIASVHWSEQNQILVFHNMPIPERIPRTAIYETIASTAVYLAIEEQSSAIVDEPIAQKALRMVEDYISIHGLATLVLIYALVTSYENHQALSFYGSIPERQFTLGSWHRPWVDYSLSDELLLGSLSGSMRVVVREGRRLVELTEDGIEFMNQNADMLEQSGYLQHRMRMQHILQFTLFDDYEDLAEQVIPNGMELRKVFIDSINIQSGMRVLEVGCGSGTLTFGAGLADLVGPSGRIVGVDPSSGMLQRAELARRLRGVGWVEFTLASAEHLPVPDQSFDATIGSAFLHFTDIHQTVAEMARATRKGGVIASLHPLQIKYYPPFFLEWFDPVLKLSREFFRVRKPYLLEGSDVIAAFREASIKNIETMDLSLIALFDDPDKVIRHFIHGIGMFQEVLTQIPWRARHELIETLLDNGRRIVGQYQQQDLVMAFPTQMVKGIVV